MYLPKFFFSSMKGKLSEALIYFLRIIPLIRDIDQLVVVEFSLSLEGSNFFFFFFFFFYFWPCLQRIGGSPVWEQMVLFPS